MTNGVQPEKKGMSTGAKIGIGCGILAVVGIIVVIVAVVAGGMFVAQKAKEAGLDPELMEKNPELAAAKMIVAANPDLELVSADEDTGTITIRNTKTDEELTVDYRDLKDGKIVFKTDQGELKIEQESAGEGGATMTYSGEEGEAGTVRYGTATSADQLPDWLPIYTGKMQIGYITQSESTDNGMLTIETSDSLESISEFYKNELEAAGFNVSTSSIESGGQRIVTVQGSDDTGGRSVGMTATQENGISKIGITFHTKK
ncbi:MAG: hypothetical protein JXQ27_02290 [Acidobacteria bacterium]|nr:hypothetical protein [Acidobacteriota bacterium]